MQEAEINRDLARLMAGNAQYIGKRSTIGDISGRLRLQTAKEGQRPFAVVLTCSDSRVIPEAIFQCGIGDLFVIRVAGNVVDDHQLGSVEYAVGHLDTGLVMVLGHTQCGAVAAAIHREAEGCIRTITDEICAAIGDETDPDLACCLNVKRSVERIENSLHTEPDGPNGVTVVGAVYDIRSGAVRLI